MVPRGWDIGPTSPMGPSLWPSWNARSHGHLHEGRTLYIHTYAFECFLSSVHVRRTRGRFYPCKSAMIPPPAKLSLNALSFSLSRTYSFRHCVMRFLRSKLLCIRIEHRYQRALAKDHDPEHNSNSMMQHTMYVIVTDLYYAIDRILCSPFSCPVTVIVMPRHRKASCRQILSG